MGLAGWTRVVGGLLLALTLLAADAGRSFEPPPASAPPEVVLSLYLRAFQTGDCATARAFWARPDVPTAGDFCGTADLGSFSIRDMRAEGAGSVAFWVILTTNGGYDGSLPPGEWSLDFYLVRQPNGVWRIDGAGNG